MPSDFHFRYCSRWRNTWCLEKVLRRLIYTLCMGLQKSHTLHGVFVNKDDHKWENKCEHSEQPFKYPALVGIVAVKKKLYFWIVNCNNLIIRSNIT